MSAPRSISLAHTWAAVLVLFTRVFLLYFAVVLCCAAVVAATRCVVQYINPCDISRNGLDAQLGP
jgi:hypothetical protein